MIFLRMVPFSTRHPAESSVWFEGQSLRDRALSPPIKQSSNGTLMRVPKTLYMYCGLKAVALLKDRRFKIKPPRQLNDPFEFAPAFIGWASKAWILKNFDRENPISESDAESLHNRQEAIRSKARMQLLEISDRYKYLCLSAQPDSILLWALYAEKHQGFVIGVNSSMFARSNLEKVSYSRKRPSVNIRTALVATTGRMMALWRRVVRTKSPDWRHEKEYRCIVIEKYVITEKDGNGDDAYFLPFNPRLITEVILGVHCDDKTTEEIKKALAHADFQHVKEPLKARLDEKDFQIRVDPGKN